VRSMKLEAPAISSTSPLREEARPKTPVITCTVCGRVLSGSYQPSIDPRWVFAKCPWCSKRVIATREEA